MRTYVVGGTCGEVGKYVRVGVGYLGSASVYAETSGTVNNLIGAVLVARPCYGSGSGVCTLYSEVSGTEASGSKSYQYVVDTAVAGRTALHHESNIAGSAGVAEEGYLIFFPVCGGEDGVERNEGVDVGNVGDGTYKDRIGVG